MPAKTSAPLMAPASIHALEHSLLLAIAVPYCSSQTGFDALRLQLWGLELALGRHRSVFPAGSLAIASQAQRWPAQ
jgi:hypothetical protein